MNTRQNTISAWQALQHTISGVQKTITQADYSNALVNRIQECYDRVWDHECSSILASMAIVLVRALTPHWKNAPEYQLTINDHLLQDDLNAVAEIVKKGLSCRRDLETTVQLKKLISPIQHRPNQPRRKFFFAHVGLFTFGGLAASNT